MKNKFMMIRATEEEKAIATSKARDMGMGLSAFIRFLVRQWDSPGKPPKPHRAVFLHKAMNYIKARIL